MPPTPPPPRPPPDPTDFRRLAVDGLRYLEHRPGCPGDPRCTCGLSEWYVRLVYALASDGARREFDG